MKAKNYKMLLVLVALGLIVTSCTTHNKNNGVRHIKQDKINEDMGKIESDMRPVVVDMSEITFSRPKDPVEINVRVKDPEKILNLQRISASGTVTTKLKYTVGKGLEEASQQIWSKYFNVNNKAKDVPLIIVRIDNIFAKQNFQMSTPTSKMKIDTILNFKLSAEVYDEKNKLINNISVNKDFSYISYSFNDIPKVGNIIGKAYNELVTKFFQNQDNILNFTTIGRKQRNKMKSVEKLIDSIQDTSEIEMIEEYQERLEKLKERDIEIDYTLSEDVDNKNYTVRTPDIPISNISYSLRKTEYPVSIKYERQNLLLHAESTYISPSGEPTTSEILFDIEPVLDIKNIAIWEKYLNTKLKDIASLPTIVINIEDIKMKWKRFHIDGEYENPLSCDLTFNCTLSCILYDKNNIPIASFNVPISVNERIENIDDKMEKLDPGTYIIDAYNKLLPQFFSDPKVIETLKQGKIDYENHLKQQELEKKNKKIKNIQLLINELKKIDPDNQKIEAYENEIKKLKNI